MSIVSDGRGPMVVAASGVAVLCLIRGRMRKRRRASVEQEYTASPYRRIPPELLGRFTLGNQIPVLDVWRDGRTPLKSKWSRSYIEDFVARFSPANIKSRQEGRSPYGHGVAMRLLAALEEHNVRGQAVAVVGSETPWIEAMLINLGNSVTTIEYNVPAIDFDPERLTGQHFDKFAQTMRTFDSVVTFSSIEHSGLGRYGDPLDPEGDLSTMRAIRRNLRAGGRLLWGAPVGPDALVWNVHRIYGNVRLPLLFSGFEEVGWYGAQKSELLAPGRPVARKGHQPVVVLRAAAD